MDLSLAKYIIDNEVDFFKVLYEKIYRTNRRFCVIVYWILSEVEDKYYKRHPWRHNFEQYYKVY